ncbi:hypothetical protein RSW80_25820, partial [Escherichia coli]|uniref:hypothetical protein n=1 Tax=Escherichia coli TaxID=562 RepID=UPI0028DE7D7B
MTTVLGSLLTDAVRIEGLCGGLETCICDGDDDAQNAILPLVQVVRAKLGDLCNALDKLDGSSQFSLRAPAPTSAL